MIRVDNLCKSFRDLRRGEVQADGIRLRHRERVLLAALRQAPEDLRVGRPRDVRAPHCAPPRCAAPYRTRW